MARILVLDLRPQAQVAVFRQEINLLVLALLVLALLVLAPLTLGPLVLLWVQS